MAHRVFICPHFNEERVLMLFNDISIKCSTEISIKLLSRAVSMVTLVINRLNFPLAIYTYARTSENEHPALEIKKCVSCSTLNGHNIFIL